VPDPEERTERGIVLHASTVAFGQRAALIRGPSGSGKSGLALQLMALGAQLVADDRTALCRAGDRVLARCPAPIRGRIEARGIGILAAAPVCDVPLCLIVDLERPERDRLPPHREECVLGVPVTLIGFTAAAHFPAAIKLYLTCNRTDPG